MLLPNATASCNLLVSGDETAREVGRRTRLRTDGINGFDERRHPRPEQTSQLKLDT